MAAQPATPNVLQLHRHPLTVSADAIRAEVAAFRAHHARGEEAVVRDTGVRQIRDRYGKLVQPGERCGTEKGYDDHRRRGGEVCQACRTAKSQREVQRQEQRRYDLTRAQIRELLCPCASCQAVLR